MSEEVEEAIKKWDDLLQLRLSKAGPIKHDTCIIGTRELQTVLKYIQEDSVPKSKVELKAEELQEKYKTCAEENSVKTFILIAQIAILKEILNEGEKDENL